MKKLWVFAWWFGISVCLLPLGACDREICGHMIPCSATCPCR